MILEGFKFSISFLKDNFSKFLLIVSLPFTLELIITSISVNYMTDESSAEFVSFPLILIIQTWAQCTIIFYIHNQQTSRSISDLYIYTLYKLPFIILWGMFVALAVALGLLLIIIPGIYIALRYSFYMFEILLSQKKGSESMKETFAMTKSKTLKIFFYFLPPFVITILLTVMIFSFVEVMIISTLYTYLLIVFFTIYTYYLYDRIKSDTDGTETE